MGTGRANAEIIGDPETMFVTIFNSTKGGNHSLSCGSEDTSGCIHKVKDLFVKVLVDVGTVIALSS